MRATIYVPVIQIPGSQRTMIPGAFWLPSLTLQDSFEFNENESKTYPNLWYTMKLVLRGMFIALNGFIKTLERSHTSNLTAHLKL